MDDLNCGDLAAKYFAHGFFDECQIFGGDQDVVAVQLVCEEAWTGRGTCSMATPSAPRPIRWRSRSTRLRLVKSCLSLVFMLFRLQK